MARPFLSVIIPAYNEASRLPLTLVDVDRHLSAQEFSYEIIVINDGSTDKTGEIVKRLAPLVTNLKLIESPDNQGKGAAVRMGMLAARGNWRLGIDADNSVSVVEFSKILPYLAPKDGADIAVASRYVKGTVMKPHLPLGRRMIEWTLNGWIRLLLRTNAKDFLIGFQCFSGEAAELLFPVSELRSWGYTAEMIALAEKTGFAVKEIPVFVSHKPGSHFLLRNYLQIFWQAIKVRLHLKKKVASLVKMRMSQA